jgi:alanine-glyoxylate transaminase/serine-glyoxylate transaminase/serine-pyruvate transaminase
MGLSLLVEKPQRLPSLNTVLIPEGLDELALRKELRQNYKIEIGAGLGSLAGKIWRVGVMGYNARGESVEALLSALKTLLGK